MGLTAANCLNIYNEEDEKRKQEERLKQYAENLKKEEEERKKKFEEERNRKDLKVLDNIEKLNINKNEFYKPLPPNKNLKFFFEKSPFMDGPKETIIEMNVLKDFSNFVIKFDESKYGIVYYLPNFDKRFVDIFECSNQKFLFRITDINGDSIKYIRKLIDGTHYIDTYNHQYIIKIIKDIGYQVLYEIQMKGNLLFLHDEKILSVEIIGKNNSNLSLFEKDNNGIYKKTKEKLFMIVVCNCIQVRENKIVSKNMDYIFFFEINTFDIIVVIKYLSRPNRMVLLSDKFLLVNSISGSPNRFNLIDIDLMKIKVYFTEDEKSEDYEPCIITDDIVDSYKLPNGYVIVKLQRVGVGNIAYMFVHWNEEANFISFKPNFNLRQFNDIQNISSFLVFKEYNLLIVNKGNSHYLYFKN
jgi:hypothetical protein